MKNLAKGVSFMEGSRAPGVPASALCGLQLGRVLNDASDDVLAEELEDLLHLELLAVGGLGARLLVGDRALHHLLDVGDLLLEVGDAGAALCQDLLGLALALADEGLERL